MSVLLSANLGVMNLLPLPALDGGRLVFILIEAVRGKPVDRGLNPVFYFHKAVFQNFKSIAALDIASRIKTKCLCLIRLHEPFWVLLFAAEDGKH